ncbi:MAG: PpiC-type peptidyl-prolyl cis-trans isomerase [Bryobacterales bacterium]|nr:PpiC-type peptidyl-prolyl cis-trans isomerase [Bryobacterales bacterium]
MLEFMKFLPFLLSAVALWGQQAAPATAAADPVVLTVGSEKITRSMFQEIISSLPAQQQAQLQTPEARRSLAEQVAELKVMAQEARTRKLDQSASFKAKVALQSDQILANAVYQELVASDPDEAGLRAYYAEHKQDWDQIKARHILIRMQGSRVPLREGHKELTDAEALAKAKEVRAKIVAGAKFEEVAKIESDDTGSGENGGDLGTFGQGQMVPEFDEVVFKAPVGQVTEPIKTAYGYHLILIEERKSKPFEDARAEIEQKIRPDIGKKAIDALKAKTPVVYDDAYFGKAADLPPAK